MPDDLAAAEPDADAANDLAQCLTPLIAQLPERYRSAIEMSEIAGLTQNETANRLGLSLSGAKSRVQRARAMLQDLLLQCCRVELDHRGAIRDYEPKRACGPERCDSLYPSRPAHDNARR
jgi:RNA polymerase sigma-70 factor (ECF subfamily)